jgi:hypothetical protein
MEHFQQWWQHCLCIQATAALADIEVAHLLSSHCFASSLRKFYTTWNLPLSAATTAVLCHTYSGKGWRSAVVLRLGSVSATPAQGMTCSE